MYLKFGKRLLDLIMAATGLLILSPFFVVITVFLWFSNDGKPFFKQARPGLDERIFTLVKFKTMNDRKDTNGHLLPDNERVTRIGNFIRKTSLDEIPQLWNVLKGEMSMIGPRPLLVEYLPLYAPRQRKRHALKPGITGWAQINGRNTISWNLKFDYDVWYVENVSFKLDMKILFLTVLKVFRREGINAGETITMEKFTG